MSGHIITEVRALGRVELHDAGFRAERIEIVAVHALACQNCGETATDFLTMATAPPGWGPSLQLASLLTCRACFPRSGMVFTHSGSVRDSLRAIALRYGCQIKEVSRCRSDAEKALWSLRNQRIQEYLESLPDPILSEPEPPPPRAPLALPHVPTPNPQPVSLWRRLLGK